MSSTKFYPNQTCNVENISKIAFTVTKKKLWFSLLRFSRNWQMQSDIKWIYSVASFTQSGQEKWKLRAQFHYVLKWRMPLRRFSRHWRLIQQHRISLKYNKSLNRPQIDGQTDGPTWSPHMALFFLFHKEHVKRSVYAAQGNNRCLSYILRATTRSPTTKAPCIIHITVIVPHGYFHIPKNVFQHVKTLGRNRCEKSWI
jgi:hypothetical protein